MWFWLAIIALLCWSGSDLFSKIGCRDASDKNAHLKMVVAVGIVMGLHAAYEIFLGGVEISLHVIWTYLPVSLLYIVSMAIGYVGLRYIELSVSSPICNSSGALVAVLTVIFGGMAALREFKEELPKYIGATCETVGQFFYIQAIADEAHVMYSAPIIAAYCVLSTVWGRVFLREKLSWKHYLMIGLTVIGIVFLGICDV